MDLNELQSVRDRERQTDKLQQLRESFYGDVGEFIEQLRAERDRAVERADNPFDSSEVRQLSDEINTAEQTVKAIYEKRVGKIVKAASFAAADMPAEVDGMTTEEQDLFDQLVGDIKQSRSGVMALLDGEDRPSGSVSTETDQPRESSTTGARGQDSPGGQDPDTVPQDTNERPSQNHDSKASDRSGESRESTGDNLNAADVMGGTSTDSPTKSGREQTQTIQSGETAPPDATDSTSQTPPPDTDDVVTQSTGPSQTEPQVRNDGGETRTRDQSETPVSPEAAQEQNPTVGGDTATPGATESRPVTESTDPGGVQPQNDGNPESTERGSDAITDGRGQQTAGDSQQQNGSGSVTASRQETQHTSEPSATTQAAEQGKPDIERQRVQILENVETFMGFDERDYDLESNDIVSLPATNADILLERGVAREL